MTLNPAQLAAVASTAELRVALAGPGSGKTRTEVEAVLAARGKVAIMTFTNSAANEFRKRIERLTPDHPMAVIYPPRTIVHCGTLHSYCFKLIQRFGGLLGYISGQVGILPDAERVPRLLQCRDKLGYKKSLSEKVLLNHPRQCKEALSYEAMVQDQARLTWREYEFLLKRNNLVDYDGILRIGLELLKDHAVHLAAVQLDYLFVDEYQDSAGIDQLIYEAIPAANKMYVGDSDQSIFAFRGANPMGFVHLARAVFDNSITGAEGFKLEVNYRSDVDICAAANKLIAHNKDRIEKVTVPATLEPGEVTVFSHEDVRQELAYLAGSIDEAQRGGSVAVLYRNHYEANQCRDYLVGMGVPVQKFKFEQRPPDWERAVLLIGLEIMPTEILIERFLLLELGTKEVARLKLESQARGEFIMAHKIKTVSFSNPLNVMPYLMMNGVSESTARRIRDRAEFLGLGDGDLSDLLHDLHSQEDTDRAPEPDGGGVYIGTMHSAKGREFDVVFLPAFEQGIIPHTRLLTGEETAPKSAFPGCLEEERRLAFVAVTRARHELYISHVEHRRGRWGPVGGLPSQFIKEMGLS